ncbi:MAG: hypothetical protein DRP00_02450 [Candidatus Aenigmatarchaeota archaeon]|nr:MAG: hypothetical protein DRP00_02450 [Candidatus Aenigmarchaeota archaeon]
MKGISLIFQFVIFFLIGLSIFLSMGMLFRSQYDIVRKDILEQRIKNVANFFAANLLDLYLSCKECDQATLTLEPEEIGIPYKISLEEDNLTISILETGKNYSIKLNNFNYSVEFSGEAFSGRPVILTLDKTKNKLRVENG